MKNPLYRLSGEVGSTWDLKKEYEVLPAFVRLKLLARVAQRELLLLLALQWPLRREKLPKNAKKILWLYNWPTVGDSIMDLSQRYFLPPDVQVDLCIPHGPADLWRSDDRFAHVYANIADCPTDYDFLILHDINTFTIKFKLGKFFGKPFCSIKEHLQGERYSPIELARQRLATLVGREGSPPYPPRLCLDGENSRDNEEKFLIALVLGGQDGRRIYHRWHEVVALLLARWPRRLPEPRFLLLGVGQNAEENLRAFEGELLEGACVPYVNALSLVETAHLIRRANMFLGADGGLMHIAAALQKPGLAFFSGIRAEWRLHPQASIQAMNFAEPLSEIPPDFLAERFIGLLNEATG